MKKEVDKRRKLKISPLIDYDGLQLYSFIINTTYLNTIFNTMLIEPQSNYTTGRVDRNEFACGAQQSITSLNGTMRFAITWCKSFTQRYCVSLYIRREKSTRWEPPIIEINTSRVRILKRYSHQRRWRRYPNYYRRLRNYKSSP